MASGRQEPLNESSSVIGRLRADNARLARLDATLRGATHPLRR